MPDQQTETPSLAIITDAEPEKIAEFLATLNDIYAELSGDELVITEARCAEIE